MAILMNHSAPFGAYGGAMAQAAAQEHYGALMNPYIRQFFEQEYQSGEATRNRDWRTGERIGSQDFSAAQSRLERDWRTGERIGTQEFSAAQAGLDRDWRTGERIGSQEYGASESALDRELAKWQSMYNNPQRTTFRFTRGYSGPGSFASEQQRIRSKYFG